jgi:hypothetical protein
VQSADGQIPSGGPATVNTPDGWVMISNFHVKIDGCVGQSLIRSYATLTRQTDQSDVVLSYVGVTKAL